MATGCFPSCGQWNHSFQSRSPTYVEPDEHGFKRDIVFRFHGWRVASQSGTRWYAGGQLFHAIQAGSLSRMPRLFFRCLIRIGRIVLGQTHSAAGPEMFLSWGLLLGEKMPPKSGSGGSSRSGGGDGDRFLQVGRRTSGAANTTSFETRPHSLGVPWCFVGSDSLTLFFPSPSRSMLRIHVLACLAAYVYFPVALIMAWCRGGSAGSAQGKAMFGVHIPPSSGVATRLTGCHIANSL